MPKPLIVETGITIPIGRKFLFRPRIKKDGAAVDLSGKTVTVTFRRESAPATSLGATWDAQAATLGNDTYTAAQGGIQLEKEITEAAYDAPDTVEGSTPYLCEVYVAELDYSPRKARFHVTRSLQA